MDSWVASYMPAIIVGALHKSVQFPAAVICLKGFSHLFQSRFTIDEPFSTVYLKKSPYFNFVKDISTKDRILGLRFLNTFFQFSGSHSY